MSVNQTQSARPTLSVVIPAYRAAQTIERALRSVAAQTVLPDEVIVVDDGSDDGTASVVETFNNQTNDPQVTLVRQENQGAGKARNAGIQEAKGEFIAFLDADDEWLPAKLERSLYHMTSGPYVFVAHDGWIVRGGSEAVNRCAFLFEQGGKSFSSLYRKGYIDTCTVVARRDAILKAGGFDERLSNAQDFDLWLALVAAPGAEFLVFDEVLSRYHVLPGTIMSRTEQRLACCLQIAARYIPVLKRRPGWAWAALAYRVSAVHFEALTVYWRRNQPGRMVHTALRLPFNLLRLSLAYLKNSEFSRPKFLPS